MHASRCHRKKKRLQAKILDKSKIRPLQSPRNKYRNTLLYTYVAQLQNFTCYNKPFKKRPPLTNVQVKALNLRLRLW